MTERWVSQKKHYCQICNTWLSGHIMNIKKHEQSTRHLENARQQLKDAYQRHQDKQKHERLLERELQQMEAAAAAAMRNDEARQISHCGGGPHRGSLPSAYDQLQAQREEKERIQQFYNQRNSSNCTTQASVSTSDETRSSSNNGDAWEFVTDQGLPFFRNKITGDVSWTPPPGASYVAASAAATAAAAAVPAAVAAASAAPTAPAPARPALRILSVKKPVKKEQPDTTAPVSPPTGTAPTVAAPATFAGAEGPLTAASAVPAHVVVKSDSSEASPAATATAPVHAAATATGTDTSVCGGVAALAAGVDIRVDACGPDAGTDAAPVEAQMPDFIPSSSSRSSSGSSAIPEGYVFKTGHMGLGFYRDRPVQQHHRHQQGQQRRGPSSRALQHHWGHAQHERQQHNSEQKQQHTQHAHQQLRHERHWQKQQIAPLKRPREEASADAVSPPADAAAAIAAAAAEAAAAAATLWGSGTAASEDKDSSGGSQTGTAAGAVETEKGLTGAPSEGLRRAEDKASDDSAQEGRDGSISDEGSGTDGDNSEETEEETQGASATAAPKEELRSATAQRRVVPDTEGPVIGPWVEAKDDGWDAIARRQQQEKQQLLLRQEQQEALEQERHVISGVEQLRRLRAQVKRRGVHHDFSWQKDEEAEYLSTSGSTTNEQSIEGTQVWDSCHTACLSAFRFAAVSAPQPPGSSRRLSDSPLVHLSLRFNRSVSEYGTKTHHLRG
ncbi:ww domain U1 zinc finger domain-containing protein, putative [Eimeria maxima]|uniref:Ww domain U1 zinc finger domain-containing protein, putative n=1 Tax=Eimeria maxima TaxID=5804 RepID=U6MGT2_EIMMA|nr:ww domain U1 zinc finger domain-containing protein, putative [Eimeria maxima]CDJ60855.1 ww domain U1 zinc finger domain-containing protein, putative [Eimeria maxima]